MWKNYREQSRNIEWGHDQEGNLTIEQINCGSLLRIADSLEKIEKPYQKLIDDYNYMRNNRDSYQRLYESELRRSAAYRGIIKKLKGRK